MKKRMRLSALSACAIWVFVGPGSTHADVILADLLCSYEAGRNPVAGFMNPNAALVPAAAPDDPNGIVSLGQWSKSTLRGEPVGLVVGFTTPVRNRPGEVDLLIKGNAFWGWYEPGFVQVARETTSAHATADGWQDETWYLLKPSNFDLVGDPRTGALAIAFSQGELDEGRNPYTDAAWSDQSALRGYADVHPDGDEFDLDWAIDLDGNPVYLPDISYVWIRTVTDSLAGNFGYFSTEIDYVAAYELIPEPGAVGLALLGAVVARGLQARCRTRGPSTSCGLGHPSDAPVRPAAVRLRLW